MPLPTTQAAPRVRVVVDVALDEDVLAAIALHRGVSYATVLAEVGSDLENRAFDSVRFRDGVVAVGSKFSVAATSRDEATVS
jgi:hypothetical protein